MQTVLQGDGGGIALVGARGSGISRTLTVIFDVFNNVVHLSSRAASGPPEGAHNLSRLPVGGPP